jgi:hypothetical protein
VMCAMRKPALLNITDKVVTQASRQRCLSSHSAMNMTLVYLLSMILEIKR